MCECSLWQRYGYICALESKGGNLLRSFLLKHQGKMILSRNESEVVTYPLQLLLKKMKE